MFQYQSQMTEYTIHAHRPPPDEPKAFCIYKLNDDCLIAIADHLDIFDWLNLYETSVRFRNIILDGIIPRKFIDFKEICVPKAAYGQRHLEHRTVYDVSLDVFYRFGKVITRFGISGENIPFKRPGNTEFDEFLQLVLDYCQNGAFREVHIEFTTQEAHRSDLITRTASYFKDVTTLKVKSTSGCNVPCLNQWLALIPKHNLQFLEFNGVQPFSLQFQLNPCALPKLEHLKLKNVSLSVENQTRMILFLAQMPQIKAFYNEDQTALLFANHIECIGKLHVARLPNVAKQSKESMPNLKCLVLHGQLRNYRDFDAAFKILAQKSSLKKLAIEICSNIAPKPVPDKLNVFIRSETNSQFVDCLHVHCGHLIRDMTQNYIEYLVTKRFEFKTCILSSNRIIHHTIERAIVRNGPKMEKLFILGQFSYSTAFYKQIVGDRERAIFGSGSPKPLTIFTANAIAWQKLLFPNSYRPETVSLASLATEEIEYF